MPKMYLLSFISLFFIAQESSALSRISYSQEGEPGAPAVMNRGYCQQYGTQGCENAYPGTTPYLWRYIPYTGYRKFSPMGAMYKDWLDYDGYYRHDGRRRFNRRYY